MPLIDTQIFDIKCKLGPIELKWDSGIYAILFKGLFIYVGMSHTNLSLRASRLDRDCDVHPILNEEIKTIGRENIYLHIKVMDNISKADLHLIEKRYIKLLNPKCNILSYKKSMRLGESVNSAVRRLLKLKRRIKL